MTESKRLIKKLDVLWADLVKTKDVCQRCKSQSKQLNACHFYSRRVKSLRWDMDNGICLCVGCHFYFHQHPAEFHIWFRDLVGEKVFDILQIRQHNILKTNLANLRLVEEVLRQEGESK